MCFLKTHPSKPLIFPKYIANSERRLRRHWYNNESECFTFENGLESFQDASHASEKILRSSCGIETQTFLGTACTWKIHCLLVPTNGSDAELRVLHEAIIRAKQCRLLLTSLGFPVSAPTKVYDDDESDVHAIKTRRITPRLRHVNVLICFLHHEHGNGVYEAKQTPSKMHFANLGTKRETDPQLMRNTSLAMGHVHIQHLLQEQYDALTFIAPISCYQHFRRKKHLRVPNILY